VKTNSSTSSRAFGVNGLKSLSCTLSLTLLLAGISTISTEQSCVYPIWTPAYEFVFWNGASQSPTCDFQYKSPYPSDFTLLVTESGPASQL
jgi:hypothetical protein